MEFHFIHQQQMNIGQRYLQIYLHYLLTVLTVHLCPACLCRVPHSPWSSAQSPAQFAHSLAYPHAIKMYGRNVWPIIMLLVLGGAHPEAGPHALPRVRAVAAQLLGARAAARGAHRAPQVYTRYPPAGTVFRFSGS